MPREPRQDAEGGVFHVYARGNDRRSIFFDDADRRRYLALLGRAVRWHRWRCLAYCLMGNHVHLLIETPGALGPGMQRLHSTYAQAYNKRHERSGHLFQSRYAAVRMESDGQLWVTAAYIARNPVEAGLCQRDEDWPWSSAGALAKDSPPPWLDTSRLRWYLEAASELAVDEPHEADHQQHAGDGGHAESPLPAAGPPVGGRG